MSTNAWRWIWVLAFWGMSVLLGVVEEWFPGFAGTPEFEIVSSVAILVALYGWLETDAIHRGFNITRGLRYLFAFLWPITLTVYLVRSRGWLGPLKFLGWFVGALVLANVATFVVMVVLFAVTG